MHVHVHVHVHMMYMYMCTSEVAVFNMLSIVAIINTQINKT